MRNIASVRQTYSTGFQRVLARVSHSHDKIGVKFAFIAKYYRASDGLLIVYVSLVAVYKFRFPIREFPSEHGTIGCS